MNTWSKMVRSPRGVLLTLLLVACDPGADPASNAGLEPVGIQAAVGYLDGWSAGREDPLKPLLEQEKKRIAQAQEDSKQTYDSLKKEWEAYLGTLGGDTSAPGTLLFCDPLQYTGDTKIIGPEGGDMSVGPHKLSIPKGALKQYTVITAEMPVATDVSVKLSPHGLQFLETPKLTLSYKHCSRPTDFRKATAYVDDARTILEWPRSADQTSDGLVNAWIRHFSKYALAVPF